MTEIFHAARADRAELARLAADGLLRPLLADVYVSLDTGVDAGAVVGLEAAAWLHAGGEGPDVVDVFLSGRRGRPLPRIRVHEVRLEVRDVETIGRVRVTGPARTAADLCRTRSTDRALADLNRLRASTGLSPRAVRAVLDRLARHRGVPHAREVVTIWQGQPSGHPVRRGAAEPATTSETTSGPDLP